MTTPDWVCGTRGRTRKTDDIKEAPVQLSWHSRDEAVTGAGAGLGPWGGAQVFPDSVIAANSSIRVITCGTSDCIRSLLTAGQLALRLPVCVSLNIETCSVRAALCKDVGMFASTVVHSAQISVDKLCPAGAVVTQL
jgi:hypothetical protein